MAALGRYTPNAERAAARPATWPASMRGPARIISFAPQADPQVRRKSARRRGHNRTAPYPK